MKLSSFRYILPEAFISMKRNPLMSVVSTLTIAITLFLCGSFWLIIQNVDQNAKTVEQDVEVKVFVAEGTNQENIDALQKRLESLQIVESVTFVSKDEALKQMGQRLGQLNGLDEGLLGRNPLPDSFTVKVKDPNTIITLADLVNSWLHVSEVRYGKGTVEKLFAVINWTRLVGIGVMILLALSAIVLVSMTIRLTVVARRDEIKVMKYVGASNAFICWPFLLEGIFIGFFGSCLAYVAVLWGYGFVLTRVALEMPFMTFMPVVQVVWLLLATMLGSGILLGAIGSTISLRRFLKV